MNEDDEKRQDERERERQMVESEPTERTMHEVGPKRGESPTEDEDDGA